MTIDLCWSEIFSFVRSFGWSKNKLKIMFDYDGNILDIYFNQILIQVKWRKLKSIVVFFSYRFKGEFFFFFEFLKIFWILFSQTNGNRGAISCSVNKMIFQIQFDFSSSNRIELIDRWRQFKKLMKSIFNRKNNKQTN